MYFKDYIVLPYNLTSAVSSFTVSPAEILQVKVFSAVVSFAGIFSIDTCFLVVESYPSAEVV